MLPSPIYLGDLPVCLPEMLRRCSFGCRRILLRCWREMQLVDHSVGHAHSTVEHIHLSRQRFVTKHSVSQKSSPFKTFCNIFTWAEPL